MKQKDFSQIKNPLTIIALFIGLTEVAFGLVLSDVPENLQSPFVWFMIAFPTVCALGFFLTLYLRPTHFYGPGDFRSDESYLAANRKFLDTVAKSLDGKQALESNPPSEDVLTAIVDKLAPAFCWYMLKVANKELSENEHIRVFYEDAVYGAINGIDKMDPSSLYNGYYLASPLNAR